MRRFRALANFDVFDSIPAHSRLRSPLCSISTQIPRLSSRGPWLLSLGS